jgi:hypothetical protein
MATLKYIPSIRSIGLILILLFFLTATRSMMGQTTDQYASINDILTEQQKEMLKNERELIKQQRLEFRKTLSEEQIKIIKDQNRTREEKRRLLAETLTKAQKDILAEHERRLERKRNEFRQSLSGEQRQMIRERYQHREGINNSNIPTDNSRYYRKDDNREQAKESGKQKGKGQ